MNPDRDLTLGEQSFIVDYMELRDNGHDNAADLVDDVITSAPALTPEQMDRIRALLPPPEAQ
jgi:hypothetical protein